MDKFERIATLIVELEDLGKRLDFDVFADIVKVTSSGKPYCIIRITDLKEPEHDNLLHE